MPVKILVADDDYFCQKGLCTFLRSRGYQVSYVINGAAACDALVRDSFDLCIIDYHLPGKPLKKIIGHCSRFEFKTPFMIITGDASPETERQARMLSPVYYAVKPFHLADIIEVIEHAVRKGERSCEAILMQSIRK